MKYLIVYSLIFLTMTSMQAHAKRKANQAPAYAEEFPKESYLVNEIKASGLNNVLPKELSPACDKADRTKVWTELMIGLAYVESKWNTNSHNPSDHAGTPSTGLFQMTGIDVYKIPDGGNKLKEVGCFNSHKETRNEEKNIHCAVWKMKELMNRGPSLKDHASAYWGPFKSYQYKKSGKGGALVAMVIAACQNGNLKKKSVFGANLSSNNNRNHWSAIEEYSPFAKSKTADIESKVGGR